MHNTVTMVSLLSSMRREKSQAVDNAVDRTSNNGSSSGVDTDQEVGVVVDGSRVDQINDNDQKGVQEAQAVTMTWTKSNLIALFIG